LRFVLNLLSLQGELEVIKEIASNKETSKMPFLMLGLDLPPPPLFKDVMEKNIIPQVILHSMLSFLLHIDTTTRPNPWVHAQTYPNFDYENWL
jgi:hypothetical protein